MLNIERGEVQPGQRAVRLYLDVDDEEEESSVGEEREKCSSTPPPVHSTSLSHSPLLADVTIEWDLASWTSISKQLLVGLASS